jgi:hypothetical protein
MGKSTQKNVIASKNGDFARFCVAILSMIMEIASTPCGKTTAPGLADKCHCEQKRSFRPFLRGNLVNGGGDCFDPVRKNHSHWISQCQKTYDAMACMLKSVLDAECPHMI